MMLACRLGFGDTTPWGDSILIAPLRVLTWKTNDALVSCGLSGGGGGKIGPEALRVSEQAAITLSAASAASTRAPIRPEVRARCIQPPRGEGKARGTVGTFLHRVIERTILSYRSLVAATCESVDYDFQKDRAALQERDSNVTTAGSDTYGTCSVPSATAVKGP